MGRIRLCANYSDKANTIKHQNNKYFARELAKMKSRNALILDGPKLGTARILNKYNASRNILAIQCNKTHYDSMISASREISRKARLHHKPRLTIKYGMLRDYAHSTGIDAYYLDYMCTYNGGVSISPAEDITRILRKTRKHNILFAVTFCIRDKKIHPPVAPKILTRLRLQFRRAGYTSRLLRRIQYSRTVGSPMCFFMFRLSKK